MLYMIRCGKLNRGYSRTKMFILHRQVSKPHKGFFLMRYAEFCYKGSPHKLTGSYYQLQDCEIGEPVWCDRDGYWQKFE